MAFRKDIRGQWFMKKIILLESDSKTLDFYRQAFGKASFDVEVAFGLDQMMDELRQIRLGESPKPDLVVMDFVLADGHGIEVLKALRKNFYTRDIPVFAFTNYQNPDTDREMHRLGIKPDKYMIKTDYTPGELVSTINDHFNGAKGVEISTA